jgi:hypothetical protein
MSDYNGPIVHVEIYDTPDDVSASRGFHGSLEWVYLQLARLVEDERKRATDTAFAAARHEPPHPYQKVPFLNEVMRGGHAQ